MKHGDYTREQAIEHVGFDSVDQVERLNCEPTDRQQTDGDESVEFSASLLAMTIPDGLNCRLTVYYYQDPEILRQIEDLGSLNWEPNGYSIE